MAQLTSMNFTQDDLQEASSFTLFNEGETTFLVTNSELKPFNNNEKVFLAFNVTGQSENNKGRTGEISLAIIQPSDKGQRYCRNMLFSIAKAVGLQTIPQDSAQMHGRMFTCDVTVEEYKGNDGTMKKKNEFKGFRAAVKPAPAQGGNPQTQYTAPSQPGSEAAPW